MLYVYLQQRFSIYKHLYYDINEGYRARASPLILYMRKMKTGEK